MSRDREELLGLIPEFGLISEAELREKAINCFLKALKAGGWQIADLDRMPFTLLIEGTAVSLGKHTRAVTLCCARIADTLIEVYGGELRLNRDYLIAGALLHDVGKITEFGEQGGNFVKSEEGRYLRHPFSGVGLCYDEGIPDEVLHIIAVHAREGDGGPRSAEAMVLHYADFMNFEPLRAKI